MQFVVWFRPRSVYVHSFDVIDSVNFICVFLF